MHRLLVAKTGAEKIQIEKKGFTVIRILGNPIKKDYIEFPVENSKGIEHPAMFPLQLIEEFVGLTCPPDGSGFRFVLWEWHNFVGG